MSHETWMLCHLREMSRKRGKVLQKLRLGCNYGAWSVLELAHRLKPHLPLRCRNMAGRSSTGKNRGQSHKIQAKEHLSQSNIYKKILKFLRNCVAQDLHLSRRTTTIKHKPPVFRSHGAGCTAARTVRLDPVASCWRKPGP